MFKYDVSVIIPIYNAEKYIEDCINSLMKQTFNINRIQVILVNDGSSDSSSQICQKYNQNYSNILYIEQPNKGVSSARNTGIKNAEGKYIMFLDSDDKISKKTIKALFNFFEKHYEEIDLVTYPICIIENENKKPHYRNQLYENSKIYNTEEYPYIGQTTVNIFVKNEYGNNTLFNDSFKLREDEDYNTRVIMKKQKIGFCSHACYYYNKHVNNTSLNLNHPYYCFEHIIKYDEDLIKTNKTKDNRIPKYIQALILNGIRWRIITDQLYPYHYDDKEYQKALTRIKKILSYIEIDTIINMPTMNLYHKFYLLKIMNIKTSSKYRKNSFSLFSNNALLFENNNIELVFTKFVYNNGLELIGHLRSPLLYFQKPELLMITTKNNKIKEKNITLFNSNHNQYNSQIETGNFFGFKIKIPIDELDNFSFKIKMSNNNFVNVSYIFGIYTPFNTSLKINSFYQKDRLFLYSPSKNIFQIKKLSLINKTKTYLLNLIKIAFKNQKAVIFRLLIKKNQKIWLYCDRAGVFDNAYYQFKHDLKKNDNIQRYYVIDEPLEKIKNKFTEEETKYIIRYQTFKHKILFLSSDTILTSFQSLSCYSPFKKGLKWYRDLIKYKLIYLQHGVLHANITSMYSNEKNEIDKIVISSYFEKENFIKNYNYTEDNLIESGMPRFDFVDINKKPENKIIYAPTWRANLIGGLHNNKRKLKSKEFLESNYYLKINALLKSEKLKSFLKKHNYIFELKLHPIFKDYVKLFENSNDYIKVSADSINLDEYKLFITDYSSFVFDFVYLKRPIMYFIPDELEFKAGLHSYRKLDMPLEDAFGQVTYDEKELIKQIEKYIKNNFKIEEKYLKRINNFFITKEKHCDKLYDALTKK